MKDKHLCFLSFCLFFSLCLCQGAYAGFVYTYAVASPMSLPHKTAGYLASIFWAAITAGRLLSIALSVRIQPVRLLMFNLVNYIKDVYSF